MDIFTIPGKILFIGEYWKYNKISKRWICSWI